MIADNFGALAEEFSNFDKSKAAIISAPYEGTVSYGKGASKGPKAIIKASQNMELYDEEINTVICDAGIATLHPLKIKRNEKPEEVLKKLKKEVGKVIDEYKFPIVLGGEHSISSATVMALKEEYKDLSVLQLDAHSDLRDSYEGTKFSHACVMRRIDEIVGIKHTVQVGIRSMDEEEKEFIDAKNHKKNVFFAKDIYKDDKWHKEAISKLSDDVFVTIDVDVFDPSIMPSTGTPEPGGLLWYGVLDFLKKVFKEKNVVGFDVVELAPQQGNSAPDFLAARLVYKLIGYKFCR